MTKSQLQKELLEKVKEGVKPSDLKKQKEREKVKDEGYSSDEGKNFADKADNKKADNNQKNNFADSEKKLLDQINSLKKQLQTYKDFKEADLKIKEKLKGEIKELKEKNQEQYKTIEQLKKQVKVKENPIETFNCYNCKKQQELSLLVLELPEGKLCQPCWQIFRKKTKENIKETSLQETKPFTCHNCQETKKETPFKVKLDATLQEYSICSVCLPLIKEYNEKEQDSERELDIWE